MSLPKLDLVQTVMRMATEPKRLSKVAVKRARGQPELLLQCPPDLSQAAREEWDRLLRELPNVVKLANVDGTMLALLCESIVLWREAMDGIRKFGAVIKTPSGFPVQSPYMAIANQQAANIEKISAEFGLSPGSRNKLPIMRFHDSTTWELPPLNVPPLKL